MIDEIEKLKYHINILQNYVKFDDVIGLAVKLDLSKSQFDDLCKICEEFERKIENEKKFNFYEFEGELKDKFSIDYQTIKMIIDDFVEYGYCVELAYIYTLLVPNPMKHIKHKYQQLANGTPDEQEMKRFIDEVVKNSRNKGGKKMKKLVLLILVSVAVYGYDMGDNIKECLGGSVEACDDIANKVMGTTSYSYFKELPSGIGLNCKEYMKAMRKGCNFGSGRCCALLGNEFHSISVYQDGRWSPKYGANCSLRNQNEAFKYYKKACDLGESIGCKQYTELQNDIDEIDRRERDKTQKGDITIRRK